ncbi:MAG: SCP2 sterol-binding domain-containing protein [Acidimicrobiales bacterium]
MPPYLSPPWVQAFNAALVGVDLTPALDAAAAVSLTASGGTFGVAQVVTGAPDDIGGPGGTVRTLFRVAGGRATLALDPAAERSADVTIVVGYDDARSIARGALDPADALAAGRVRVRGELAVLVAAQSVLNAVAGQLGPALDGLTDGTARDDADRDGTARGDRGATE